MRVIFHIMKASRMKETALVSILFTRDARRYFLFESMIGVRVWRNWGEEEEVVGLIDRAT